MLDMIVFIPMQDSAKDDIVPTEKTEKTELEPWNQSWSHLRDHPVTFMCPKWSFLRQWNHGCEEAYCKHACEMEAKRCRVGMIGICDAWDNVKVSKSRISSQMSFCWVLVAGWGVSAFLIKFTSRVISPWDIDRNLAAHPTWAVGGT